MARILPQPGDGKGPGKYDYDLFTIGAGVGGVRASRFAAEFGAKAAHGLPLGEKKVAIDTLDVLTLCSCPLRGCVPKKILMYGSAFSAEFKDSKEYGWNLNGGTSFDWKRLIANKTKEITRLNGVYRTLLSKVAIYEGFATIIDPHTVEVRETGGSIKRFSAERILVATGGRAVRLNIPGKELAMTSDEGLSLEEFPKRVLIIGGGYIAVEFAGIYNGMGADVNMFYRKPLPLSGFDEELRGVVINNLHGRGIKSHPGTNIVKLEKVAGGIKATTDKGEVYEADAVMFAVGRRPTTKNIGLEKAGVELDRVGAIKVDAYSQSKVPSIWAIGDVTNRLNLTPVASMEADCFVNTEFVGKPTKTDYVNIASAVFCQPPLSVVGLTEEQAVKQAKNDILVFTSSFNPLKNTISGRDEKTFVKLVVDVATDKVLGVAIVGPDAAETIQAVAIAVKCGATKAQFDSTVGIHPTSAEELVTMRTATRRVNPKGEVTKL